MTFRILSGTERLVQGVQAYFAAQALTTTVAYGKRELSKTLNQGPGRANRVVFVGFDPKSGDAGTMQEPRKPGLREIMSETDPTVRVGSTRALFDWERVFMVSVWAFDGDDPENDLAQDVAAEQLLNHVAAAMHATGFADVQAGKVNAVVQGERPFGRELRALFKFTHPLYEAPKETAHPDLDDIERINNG